MKVAIRQERIPRNIVRRPSYGFLCRLFTKASQICLSPDKTSFSYKEAYNARIEQHQTTIKKFMMDMSVCELMQAESIQSTDPKAFLEQGSNKRNTSREFCRHLEPEDEDSDPVRWSSLSPAKAKA